MWAEDLATSCCYPGMTESDTKLKASFCLRFPYTQSLLKTPWVLIALLKPDIFFFTELIYTQHHESQKHIFAWTQEWNIIHFLCCRPEMPFKALWTQLSNKHHLLYLWCFCSKVGIFFVFSLERTSPFLYPSSASLEPSSLPHSHTKTLLNCVTVRLTSNPN